MQERLILALQKIAADIKKLEANSNKVQKLTQAQYDALPVKDPNVIYVVQS